VTNKRRGLWVPAFAGTTCRWLRTIPKRSALPKKIRPRLPAGPSCSRGFQFRT